MRISIPALFKVVFVYCVLCLCDAGPVAVTNSTSTLAPKTQPIKTQTTTKVVTKPVTTKIAAKSAAATSTATTSSPKTSTKAAVPSTEFTFTLSELRACSSTSGAKDDIKLFNIVCDHEVKSLKINFPTTLTTHDVFLDRKQAVRSLYTKFSSVKEAPTTYDIDVCPKLSASEPRTKANAIIKSTTCTKYRFIIRHHITAKPKLAPVNGLVVSSSQSDFSTTSFNADKYVHNIVVPYNEPVIFTAIAPEPFFVYFNAPPDPAVQNKQQQFIRFFTYKRSKSISLDDSDVVTIYVADPEATLITEYTLILSFYKDVTPQLADLQISPNLAFLPAFGSSKFSYAARVPLSTNQVTLNVKLVDQMATFCALQTLAKYTMMNFDSWLVKNQDKLFNQTSINSLPKVFTRGFSVVQGSGSVTLPTPNRSNCILVHCYTILNPMKFVRYIVTVEKQPPPVKVDIGTLSIPTYVWTEQPRSDAIDYRETNPGFSDHQPFVFMPRTSTSYFGKDVRIHANWVMLNFTSFLKETPMNQYAFEINDVPVSSEALKEVFLTVPAGEKRSLHFKIVPLNKPDAVVNDYEIVIDRTSTPWYKHPKLFSKLSSGLGLASCLVSAQNSINFLQNIKFLQFLSMTSRLHDTTEQFYPFAQSMHPYNLQRNVAFEDEDTSNAGWYSLASETTLNDDDTTRATETRTRATRATTTTTTTNSRIMGRSLLQTLHEFPGDTHYVVDKKDSSNFASLTLRQMKEYSASDHFKDSSPIHRRKTHRLLQSVKTPPSALESEASFADTQFTDQRSRVASYFQEKQKVSTYTTSLAFLSVTYLIVVTLYSILWHYYLKNSRMMSLANVDSASNKSAPVTYSSKLSIMGISVSVPFVFDEVRRDCLVWLHPARFWTSFYEFTFIPIAQLTLGLLLIDSRFYHMPVQLGYVTVTPQAMMIAGVAMLVFGPCFYFLVGACVLMQTSPEQLAFSNVYHQYHDRSVRCLKAIHTKFASIPLLSSLFKTEISQVACIDHIPVPTQRHHQYQKQYHANPLQTSKLDFSSPLSSSTSEMPWFVGHPSDFKGSLESMLNRLTEAGDDYSGKLDQHTLGLLSHFEKTEAMTVHPETKDVLVTIEPDLTHGKNDQKMSDLYEQYASANVGNSEFCVRGSYGGPISIRTNVCLSHLPAIFQVKLFSIWTPFENLQQKHHDSWKLFFAYAPKNYMKYWILEHLVVLMMLLLLSTSVSSSTDVYVVFGWMILAALTLAVTSQPMVQTAASKWVAHMKQNYKQGPHQVEQMRTDNELTSFNQESYTPHPHFASSLKCAKSAPVWPFNELTAKEQFDNWISDVFTSSNTLNSLWLRYVVVPISRAYHCNFWYTRFWFTVREFLTSPRAETSKFLMITMFSLNHFLGSESLMCVSIVVAALSLLMINFSSCVTLVRATTHCVQEFCDSLFAWGIILVDVFMHPEKLLAYRSLLKHHIKHEASVLSSKYMHSTISSMLSPYPSYSAIESSTFEDGYAHNGNYQESTMSMIPNYKNESTISLQQHKNVYEFHVRNISVLNDEFGLHLTGQHEAFHKNSPVSLVKRFHCFAPLYVKDRLYCFYQTMPIQMPLFQFIAAEKGKDIPSVGYCAGTVQLIKDHVSEVYRQSIARSQFEPQKQEPRLRNHAVDRYLSLYTSSQFIPDLGKIYVKKFGHGYTMHYNPIKHNITIRGPEIHQKCQYHILSTKDSESDSFDKTSKMSESKPFRPSDFPSHLVSGTPVIRGGFSTLSSPIVQKQGFCKSSGVIILKLCDNERPSQYHAVSVINQPEDIQVTIQPYQTKISYTEYGVGQTMRYELVLKSRFFKPSTHPYNLEWTKAVVSGQPINAIVNCEQDGTLVLPWNTDRGVPNMVAPVLLQVKCSTIDHDVDHGSPPQNASADEKQNRQSFANEQAPCIIVDPLETDAHEFYYQSPSSWSRYLSMQSIKNSFVGINTHVSSQLPKPPVPCTIVQCVNPYSSEYRIEPNFKAASISLQADIEQLHAIIDYDFKKNTLPVIASQWSNYISIEDYTTFWNKMGFNLDSPPSVNDAKANRENPVIDLNLIASWVDPMAILKNQLGNTLTPDTLMCKLESFCHLLLERVTAHLDYLTSLRQHYEALHEAYEDPTLYAALLKRDHDEWSKNHQNSTNTNVVSEYQHVKSKYMTSIPTFEYPMTISQQALSFRSYTEPQLGLWRETIIAWLAQCEHLYVSSGYLERHSLGSYLNQSMFPHGMLDYSNSKAPTQATSSGKAIHHKPTVVDIFVEDVIRSLHQLFQTTMSPVSQCFTRSSAKGLNSSSMNVGNAMPALTGSRPILHYVTMRSSLDDVRSHLITPEIPTHYAMVRLFGGSYDDADVVDWNEQIWAPCFIKLSQDDLHIFFPAENVLLSKIDEFSEQDVFKRFPWSQIQGYRIPLACFDDMSLGTMFENEPMRLLKLSDVRLYRDFQEMTSKLVFHKRAKHVDNSFVLTKYGDVFLNDIMLNGKIYKLMLCNTVHSHDRHQYLQQDIVHHGVTSHVCPLTFRLFNYDSFYWQAILDYIKEIPADLGFTKKHAKLMADSAASSEGPLISSNRDKGINRLNDRYAVIMAKSILPEALVKDTQAFFKKISYDDDLAHHIENMVDIKEYYDYGLCPQKYLAKRCLYLDQQEDFGLDPNVKYDEEYLQDLFLQRQQNSQLDYSRSLMLQAKDAGSAKHSSSANLDQSHKRGDRNIHGFDTSIELSSQRFSPNDLMGDHDGDGQYGEYDSLPDSQSLLRGDQPKPSVTRATADVLTNKFSEFFAAAKTKLKSATDAQIQSYRADFEVSRTSGKHGLIYDKETGSVLNSATWIEGQRWGKGLCTFDDFQDNTWKFDGEFAADEFVEGQLNLLNSTAYNNYKKTCEEAAAKEAEEMAALLPLSSDKQLKNAQNCFRFKIVKYEGKFYLPQTVIQKHENYIERKFSYNPMYNTEAASSMRQMYLGAICNQSSARTKKDDDIVVDLPRGISAGADEATLSASIALAKQIYDDEMKSYALPQQVLRDDLTDLIGDKAGMSPSEKMAHEKTLSSTADSRSLDEDFVIIEKYGVRMKVPASKADEILTKSKKQFMSHYSDYLKLLTPERLGIELVQQRLAEGKALFADGTMYNGELRDGLPNGIGIFYDPVMDVTMHGNFKNGKPHGYCVITEGQPNAADPEFSYYGEFRHGVRSGPGTLVTRNRDITVVGCYEKGKLNGSNCCVVLSDVSAAMPRVKGYKSYKGGIESNRFHRQGEFTWNDGYVFNGQFVNGLRRQGCLKDPAGQIVYEGEFKDDVPHGHGTLLYPDGHIYRGELAQKKRQGIGELVYRNTVLYEGMWLNDQVHGRGVLHCEDGVYDGEFKSGKRAGKGRFTFKDPESGVTRIYDGNWTNDYPDGVGTYTGANGQTITLKFTNGVIDPASLKAYKSGLCGKAKTIDDNFYIQPSPLRKVPTEVEGLDHCVNSSVQESIHAQHASVTEDIFERDTHFMEQEEINAIEKKYEEFINAKQTEVPELPKLTDLPSGMSSRYIDLDNASLVNQNSHNLRITLERGEKLPATSESRKLHPYCRVRVGPTVRRTKPINSGGSSPQWLATLVFPETSTYCDFEVWDKQPLGADTYVGSGQVGLENMDLSSPKSIKVPLKKETRNSTETQAGYLYVTLHLVPLISKPTGRLDSASAISRSPHKATNMICTFKIHSLKAQDLDLYSNLYFVVTLDDVAVTSDPVTISSMPMPLDICLPIQCTSMSFQSNIKIETWRKITYGTDELYGIQHTKFQEFPVQTLILNKYDAVSHREVIVGEIQVSASIQ